MTLSPLWLAIAGAVLLIIVPALAVLYWQHKGWRRAEQDRSTSERHGAAMTAALDASPDGYFGWFSQDDDTGQCSRRLAVLLDLYRGLDSNFEDILSGFEKEAADLLIRSVKTLRRDGRGFTIDLNHVATGRRIEARGVRASMQGENGESDAAANVSVDMVWMSDVTEGVAAVDTLTQENKYLVETNQRLKSTLDGLTSPVWLRDDDLSLVYCNAAYIKAVDARNISDVTSRGREIAPRAAVREVRALAAAARASGVTRSAPFHMVIDGSRRLMEVTENPVSLSQLARFDEQEEEKSETSDAASTATSPTLFGDGSGLMTAGVAYDVTRQEELETRLGRETAAHAEVLERLGTAIAVFGADQRLAFHNTAFTQLWGLDSHWLRDGPSYGAVLEALRDQRRLPEVADFPAFKQKELDRFHSLIDPLEDVMHLPDGMTLRRVVAPHPMGGLLTTYEDVTDTLAMERSYNTLIAVQRETIDNLNEAIAVFTTDGQLQLANPAFLSLWNLPKHIVEDQPSVADVMEMMAGTFADAANLTGYQSLVLGALSPDSERLTRQAKFECRDGVVVEVVAAPLPDGGVLFSYDDISDPARVEHALRTRARTLTDNEKLRSAFIADAMDELRTPLKMLTVHSGDIQETAAEHHTAHDTAMSLLRLIDDISVLSSLDTDKDTLTLDSFDLIAALNSVTGLTRESFKAKSFTVELDVSDSIEWMVGDSKRIRQMLYHLICGAVDGTRPGSTVTLSVQKSAKSAKRSGLVIKATGPSFSGHDDTFHWTGFALIKHVSDLHGGTCESETLKDGTRQVVCRLPDNA
jgi:PAS domain-containing protein